MQAEANLTRARRAGLLQYVSGQNGVQKGLIQWLIDHPSSRNESDV